MLKEQTDNSNASILTVDKGQQPYRIDKFIASKYKFLSRSKIQKLLKSSMIEVNEAFVKQNYKVQPNDVIIIHPTETDYSNEIIPEKVDFEVIYEDNSIIIVDKPAGIVVHPGVGNYRGTLLNGLLYYYESKHEENIYKISRLGLVHRIDKDTSGSIVFAKDEETLANLSAQFAKHSTFRKYYALVWGDMEKNEGTINEYICRDQRLRQNYTVSKDPKNAKHAITYYKVLERLRYVTLIECKLETGRTHQIRVHMKHIGHTIFQDKRYGGDKILKGVVHKRYKSFYESVRKVIDRQALHAKELGFVHPKTNKEMFFDSPLPSDFMNCLNMWRNYKN